MVHRKLLAVFLVCCLGLSLFAAQPALAAAGPGVALIGEDSDGLVQDDTVDGLIGDDSTDDDGDGAGDDTSETTDDDTSETADEGSTESEGGDDESKDDDGWGSQDGNESDDESGWGGHSDNDSADEERWGGGSDGDHRWGDHGDNESDNESSAHRGGEAAGYDNDSETESDGENANETNANENDSDATADRERFNGSSNGTAVGNGTWNSTTRLDETPDGFLLDDVTDIMFEVANVTRNLTADVTDGTTDGTGLNGNDAGDLTTDRDGGDDARLRPSSALNRTFDGELEGTFDDEIDGALDASGIDERPAFVTVDGDRGVTAGVERLVTVLKSESALVSGVVSALADSPNDDEGRQLSTDAGDVETTEGPTDGVDQRTGERDSSDPNAAGVDAGDDDRTDGDDVAGGDSGDGGGDAPPNGPGEGAALLVLVGYLGGGRLAMNQTAMLASMGQPGLVGTLYQSVTSHLGGLSDRVVPPVFGYSRHDSSDPLENETRARIFELVSESPGMYYAQLAEETDVTVETVRYHCRILADEGLVERRKLRGRKRLYPVSMDDDDPELAAAMADSAAADVLSAIERREPTTLSAVADAVDCAPSTVSYHLDRLEEDGLVSRERDGGSVRIRLRRATKSALQGKVADD